jgi:acyl-CoA hydrolase
MTSCAASEFCGTVISHVMMPYHANPAGNVNGGVIMQLIDDAAFVIATRFARTNVVTASIERIDFHRPVHVGDLLTLKGCLNMTRRSSMEIGVRVEGEEMKSGKTRHIASAYLTFVALDEHQNPTPIPDYAPSTREAKRRHREALQRRDQREAQLREKNNAT